MPTVPHAQLSAFQRAYKEQNDGGSKQSSNRTHKLSGATLERGFDHMSMRTTQSTIRLQTFLRDNPPSRRCLATREHNSNFDRCLAALLPERSRGMMRGGTGASREKQEQSSNDSGLDLSVLLCRSSFELDQRGILQHMLQQHELCTRCFSFRSRLLALAYHRENLLDM